MLQFTRIDDRLIHGQVAVYWVNAVAADTIIVANDQHANNSMLRMSLSLGKPPGINMLVLTLEKAIAALQAGENQKKKIFLIVGSAKDCYTIAQQVEDVKEIGIGGMRHSPDRISLSSQVHLNDEDIDYLQKLNELGRHVFIQEVPSTPKTEYQDVVSQYKKGKGK
jgi:mannose/fructose/N-acetylgalactosamine-specific phosphotransferase system component IIB